MNEELESTLSTLRKYVAANGLAKQVSLRLDGSRIRISLLAEGRDLWLGRRHYLVSDRGDEPELGDFFELNDDTLSRFLALPPGVGGNAADKSESHVLFVSYSQRDEGLVAPLVDLLRLTDTRVFRDRDGVRAGARWRDTIEEAIRNSTECLVFWCAHASSSPEVAREVSLALRLGKTMVPVRLDDSPLSAELSEFQAIDLRRFEPHPPAAPTPASKDGSTAHDGTPLLGQSTSSQVAPYFTQQLANLLGVEPLLLSAQGRSSIDDVERRDDTLVVVRDASDTVREVVVPALALLLALPSAVFVTTLDRNPSPWIAITCGAGLGGLTLWRHRSVPVIARWIMYLSCVVSLVPALLVLAWMASHLL